VSHPNQSHRCAPHGRLGRDGSEVPALPAPAIPVSRRGRARRPRATACLRRLAVSERPYRTDGSGAAVHQASAPQLLCVVRTWKKHSTPTGGHGTDALADRRQMTRALVSQACPGKPGRAEADSAGDPSQHAAQVTGRRAAVAGGIHGTDGMYGMDPLPPRAWSSLGGTSYMDCRAQRTNAEGSPRVASWPLPAPMISCMGRRRDEWPQCQLPVDSAAGGRAQQSDLALGLAAVTGIHALP